MANRRIELDFIVSDEKVPALQGVLMTFISRAARYVLRKRVRTAVLFIVLTIITASMLSATAVSRAAQHEAGQIEKQAVGGFVLASNLQGGMLTPRGAEWSVRRCATNLEAVRVGSCMVRQNATADLVGASVVKVPGGDDYDAEKEQQFGNTANVIAQTIRQNSMCSRPTRSAWSDVISRRPISICRWSMRSRQNQWA